MKKHTYCVSYITKRNRRQNEHGLYIDADNAKEARACFDKFYETVFKGERNVPHPFHIVVFRMKEDDILDIDYMHISAEWVL